MSIEVDFQDGREEIYPSFEEITCLENYNDIVFINCSSNKLTKLPILPDSLQFLYSYLHL